MLNWIFFALIATSVLVGAFTNSMPALTKASTDSAKTAVELAIGLIGQMALWLGFMGILKEAGLLRGLARLLKPIMTRVFPDVPADHPAMGAMIMNIAANMLGLGNAATPFGLKAMAELNKLNTKPGAATNAMALFLVINTSGLAIFPLGVVGLRAAQGSHDPAGIIVPSILGSLVSTIVAVIICKALERLPFFSVARVEVDAPLTPAKQAETENKDTEEALKERPSISPARAALVGLILIALIVAVVRSVGAQNGSGVDVLRSLLSDWMLPVLMLTMLVIGVGRHVPVYEAFIGAAKEGFQVAVTIIPYLVAIIVAIGMFRASGAMEATLSVLSPVTSFVGLPAEALPMALIRPLSGSGSLGVLTETMKTYGPDSYVGYLVSLINGSSETTFYVLAVYFGAVQVRAVRHTLAACLTADTVGLFITIAICKLFFGGAPLTMPGH